MLRSRDRDTDTHMGRPISKGAARPMDKDIDEQRRI